MLLEDIPDDCVGWTDQSKLWPEVLTKPVGEGPDVVVVVLLVVVGVLLVVVVVLPAETLDPPS